MQLGMKGSSRRVSVYLLSKPSNVLVVDQVFEHSKRSQPCSAELSVTSSVKYFGAVIL